MKSSIMRRAEATARVQVRSDRAYWEPSKALRAAGFVGRPLGPLTAAALNQADEMNLAADRYLKDATAARPSLSTIAAILDDYQASPDYLALAASTRRNADRHLRLARAQFGKTVADQMTEAQVDDWNDALGGGTDARNIIGTLRTALNWAVAKRKIGRNPAREVKLAPRRKRRRIATREELWALVTTAEALSRRSIADFAVTCTATMQRNADILGLDSREIAGGVMFLTQNKTKRDVNFRLHPLILDRLGLRDGTEGPVILDELTALPYGERAFERAWETVRAKAAEDCPSLLGNDPAVRDPNFRGALQANDLRRTGMVWAAEAGAPVQWICAVSGHTIDEGYEILEHYLPRTRLMADRAVLALDLINMPSLDEIGAKLIAA